MTTNSPTPNGAKPAERPHNWRIWAETTAAVKISCADLKVSRVAWVPKSLLTIHRRDGNIINATLPLWLTDKEKLLEELQ